MVRAPFKLRWEPCGSSDSVRPSGVERRAKSPRFFVVKNSDLAAQFRQPPNWKAFGFVDAKMVEKYEDNWDILS